MKEIPNGYVPLTPKMKEKIGKAQDNLGLTDKNVAITLGKHLDGRNYSKKDTEHRIWRYKNIKRVDSSISYISNDLLSAIANCLKVSSRYLQDETQDDFDGSIPFTIVPPRHRRLLFEELENDDKSTEALYFLFCELPADIRKQYIPSFIDFIDFFRKTCIYSSTAFIERTEAMAKLLQNDTFFGDSYIEFMQAGDCLKAEDREKALQIYLQLILKHGNRKTTEDRELMSRVLRKLSYLNSHWDKFPTELSEKLQLIKSGEFNFAKYPDVKTIIDQILLSY